MTNSEIISLPGAEKALNCDSKGNKNIDYINYTNVSSCKEYLNKNQLRVSNEKKLLEIGIEEGERTLGELDVFRTTLR